MNSLEPLVWISIAVSIISLFGVFHIYFGIDRRLDEFGENFSRQISWEIDSVRRDAAYQYARKDETKLQIKGVEIRFDGMQAAINELKMMSQRRTWSAGG